MKLFPRTLTLKRWQYIGIPVGLTLGTFWITAALISSMNNSWAEELRNERKIRFATKLCPELQLVGKECETAVGAFTY